MYIDLFMILVGQEGDSGSPIFLVSGNPNPYVLNELDTVVGITRAGTNETLIVVSLGEIVDRTNGTLLINRQQRPPPLPPRPNPITKQIQKFFSNNPE